MPPLRIYTIDLIQYWYSRVFGNQYVELSPDIVTVK